PAVPERSTEARPSRRACRRTAGLDTPRERHASAASVSRPNRDSTAARAYLDLQARARRERRPTDELLALYILERFLHRLSISAHRERLVLKGGMLLAAFDERRPTADVDLLARWMSNDVEAIAGLVREILTVEVDDGVVFESLELRAEVIREADLYSGVRV